MKQYEGKIVIHAAPDTVFRFVSSISNIPSYLPAIREARLEEDCHIFAVSEAGGEKRELNGFFRVSTETRCIEWGSDGSPEYRGWLEVRDIPAAEGSSELAVHLSMEPGAEREVRIGERLDAVLHAIRKIVEEQGGGRVIGEERRVNGGTMVEETNEHRLARLGYEVVHAANGGRMIRRANLVLQNATDDEIARLSDGKAGIDQLLQEREARTPTTER